MATHLVDSRARDTQIKGPALYLGLLPVLLFIAFVIGFRPYLRSTVAYEPPFLLPVLSTVFLFLVSCVVAYVAMRSYLLSGAPTILLLGCGVLSLGAGALAAGWLIGPEGPNVNVTIFNVSALLSSVFHSLGALFDFRQRPPEADPERRRHKVLAGYFGVSVFVAILALAASLGFMPPFFVQGVGPTALRQEVLAVALVLFAGAASYKMSRFITGKRMFFYWYSLALTLLAMTLIGAMLQPAVGSLLGWASRCCQYLAGIYFLLSVNAALREARNRGVSVDGAIAELFREGEVRWILEAMMDSIPLGIGIAGGPPDFPILKVSRAGWEMMGGPQPTLVGPPSGQHQNAWGIVRADGLATPEPEEMPLYRASRLGERVTNAEFMLKGTDGTQIPVLVDAAPIRDDQGRIVGAVNCWRDITEQKRAEEAVRTTLQRFYTVLSKMHIAVVLATDDNRVEFVNQAVCDYFGWSEPPEDIAGLASSDLIEKMKNAYLHPEEAVARLKEIIGQGQPVKGEEVVMRNGCTHLRDFMPIRMAGQSYGRLWYQADITDRKRMEEELRKSYDELEQRVAERTEKLARLAAAMNSASEGIIIADTEWRIMHVNDAFTRLSGYTEAEAIGREMYFLRPEKADHAVYDEARASAQAGQACTRRYPVRRKDGNEFHVEGARSPVKDSEGNIVSYVVLWRDISEQLKLEEQLRQSHKMEAIGTLAGGVAHDFNNMLAIIIGNAELALDDTPESDGIRHNLDAIFKAAKRGRDLVKQILTFSRKSEQQQKNQHLTPLIEESFKLLRASIPSTIEMKLAINTKSDVARVNEAQFQQIIVNLCSNAAHAMQEKGGLLEISLEDERLHLDDSPDSPPRRYLKLTVNDTGIGMGEEIKKRIFDPFFTTKGPGEGTGMGLAVVYGIVEAHNGIITVHSEPDKGSTFSVFLPKTQSSAAPRTEASGSDIAGGEERLMFIDDEDGIIEMARPMLERLGYKVVSFNDPEAALDAFVKAPGDFDLIITDQTMPKMTGVALAGKLKAVRPDIPVMLCTGYSQTVSAKEAKARGIEGYVMKPLARKELAEAIRKVLDQGGV
jgi:PAS domain S-box-containing protein